MFVNTRYRSKETEIMDDFSLQGDILRQTLDQIAQIQNRRPLQRRPTELVGATVVSFCTGGIRCEKAAIWMQQAGYQNVLQLEGGIAVGGR